MIHLFVITFFFHLFGQNNLVLVTGGPGLVGDLVVPNRWALEWRVAWISRDRGDLAHT